MWVPHHFPTHRLEHFLCLNSGHKSDIKGPDFKIVLCKPFNYPSMGEGINKLWYTHTQWNIIQTQNGKRFWHMLHHRWTVRTCHWVKLTRYERTNLIWFHLYEVLRTVKFRDIKKNSGCHGLGEGNRELFNECRVLVWEDEKSSARGWLYNSVNILSDTELCA